VVVGRISKLRMMRAFRISWRAKARRRRKGVGRGRLVLLRRRGYTFTLSYFASCAGTCHVDIPQSVQYFSNFLYFQTVFRRSHVTFQTRHFLKKPAFQLHVLVFSLLMSKHHCFFPPLLCINTPPRTSQAFLPTSPTYCLNLNRIMALFMPFSSRFPEMTKSHKIRF
jgi:hypothetical protein